VPFVVTGRLRLIRMKSDQKWSYVYANWIANP
jgi:hypothetical protein